jgi:hypothetical protein
MNTRKSFASLMCAVLAIVMLAGIPLSNADNSQAKAKISANLGIFNPYEWNSSTRWWAQVADTWAIVPYRFTVEPMRREKFIVGIWYREAGTSKAKMVKQKMALDCTYESKIMIEGLCPLKEYEYYFFAFQKGFPERTGFPSDFPNAKYLKKFKTKLPRVKVSNKVVRFLEKDKYTIQADCYDFLKRKNCYVEIFICALCDNQGAIGPKDAGTKYWQSMGTGDKRYGPGTDEDDEIQYFKVVESDKKFDHYYRFVFTYPDSGRWITQETDWTRFQIIKQ